MTGAVPAAEPSPATPYGPGAIIPVLKPRSWGAWRIRRRRYLVHSAWGYEIDLWEINSHQQLADWLFHVGGKDLDTPNFFLAMRAIFRPVGWTEKFSGKAMVNAYLQASSAA